MDQLGLTVSATVSPPTGGNEINFGYLLAPESHGKNLKVRLNIPANTTNFALPLTGFSTVAAVLIVTDNPLTVAYGSPTAEARQVRKIQLETLSNQALMNLYFTTTGLACNPDVIVIGD